ncbi:MAG TPA: proline dehydrogenase family protein [archaeon]|nr:proline dehydrogenase family protein [archaeon]
MNKALLPIVKRFIAGETIEGAVARVRHLNSQGVRGLVDYLGEHSKAKDEAEKAVRVYLEVLALVKREGLESDVSLKLTHFGLDLGKRDCIRRVKKVCAAAKAQKAFVWVDMEDSAYTQDTIDAYDFIFHEYKNAGLCLQACLKRTEKDLELELRRKGKIRLVKGAYREQPSVAFQRKSGVDESFSRLQQRLFEKGDNFAIATHDLKLLHEAKHLKVLHSGKNFEVQMLMGVRDSLKPQLVREGFNVSEYVPFGENWLPYYSRRLREVRNLGFALKAALLMR